MTPVRRTYFILSVLLLITLYVCVCLCGIKISCSANHFMQNISTVYVKELLYSRSLFLFCYVRSCFSNKCSILCGVWTPGEE